jgi:IS5 family transposase
MFQKFGVSNASVHDSRVGGLLEEKIDKEQPLYTDSAYVGADQEKAIEEAKMTNCIYEKGYRNVPLTETQKASDKEKSKRRARVEHPFAFMGMSMHGVHPA